MRRGRAAPNDHLQTRRDFFAGRLAPQKNHPFPGGVQLIKRHFHHPLRNMGHVFDQCLEWLALELAQRDVADGRDIKVNTFAARTTDEIRR